MQRVFSHYLTNGQSLAFACQAGGDAAEDVTNLGAEQRQNGDNHNGYQNQYQSVLYQTLTFFAM
jgi:hypothetical protein